MTIWRCLVAGPDGLAQWRTIEAPSETEALARVAVDGSVALRVRAGGSSIGDLLASPVTAGGRLGVPEQALLLTQLATLVSSGLPVDRSLDLLREQARRPGQRRVLAGVLSHVRVGNGLGAALAESGVFPTYVIGVVRAAEQGGGLPGALTALAERLTLASTTRRQLVTALTYPAAVLLATVMALLVVLTLVVPQFAPIFEGQKDRLPALTRMVLLLSEAVSAEPLLVTLLAMGLPLTAAAAILSRSVRRAIAASGWHVPFLALRDQYLAAQFTGVFATLVGNGVRVVDALPLARDAIGSARWRDHAVMVERRVREGSSLSAALAEGALLPATAIRLIEVGERSGALASTCAQASAVIGEASRARIERIVALANPVAIMTLGGLVAALMGGVMLGIFAMGDFAS